jgi:hypothetical protein
MISDISILTNELIAKANEKVKVASEKDLPKEITPVVPFNDALATSLRKLASELRSTSTKITYSDLNDYIKEVRDGK